MEGSTEPASLACCVAEEKEQGNKEEAALHCESAASANPVRMGLSQMSLNRSPKNLSPKSIHQNSRFNFNFASQIIEETHRHYSGESEDHEAEPKDREVSRMFSFSEYDGQRERARTRTCSKIIAKVLPTSEDGEQEVTYQVREMDSTGERWFERPSRECSTIDRPRLQTNERPRERSVSQIVAKVVSRGNEMEEDVTFQVRSRINTDAERTRMHTCDRPRERSASKIIVTSMEVDSDGEEKLVYEINRSRTGTLSDFRPRVVSNAGDNEDEEDEGEFPLQQPNCPRWDRNSLEEDLGSRRHQQKRAASEGADFPCADEEEAIYPLAPTNPRFDVNGWNEVNGSSEEASDGENMQAP